MRFILAFSLTNFKIIFQRLLKATCIKIKYTVKLRRFIARHFSRVVKFAYSQRFHFLDFAKNPPVIILTPGKVGSSSVYYTLKKHISNPVFHIHRISEDGINKSVKEHLSSDRKSTPLHLIVSKLLQKKLSKYNGQRYAICIIREPVSRAISAFYQNTEFYRNTVEKNNLEIDTNASLKILESIFKENISQHLENWFYSEIYKEFGIDIFSKPFNSQKGYQLFKTEKTSLLILKMETMNNVFTKAIKELLGIDKTISIENANIAENKHYAASYTEAKKSFKLNKEQLDEIIQSKYFIHFYPEQEQLIRKKWQKNYTQSSLSEN